MFSLHNESNEVLVLTQVIDTSVPGCRVTNNPITETIFPDDTLTFMGYEPGISYVIRPINSPEQYRDSSGWTRNESKRQTNSGVAGKSSNPSS